MNTVYAKILKALNTIANQSLGDDWTAEQAVTFMKQHAREAINEAQIAPDSVKSSVPVKYWDCYGSEYPMTNTHQFDVDDQRMSSGQMRLDIGAIEGNPDDMLCVLLEVSTNPLNGIDHVPCAHIAFDGDNHAVSLFKVSDDILLRPEAGVSIEPITVVVNGICETMYRIS